MILDTPILMLLGVGIGIFAGLCPGIHINTTIPLLLSVAPLIKEPISIAVLITSVSITEMFIDQIPAIFLGSPDADTALSVLPGHRMLFEGRGYEAIKITVIGNLGTLLVSLIIICFLFKTFGSIYELSRPYMHLLIIGAVIFMAASERHKDKIFKSIFIIFLSGIFGILVLNSPLDQQDILFPTFTGLFGLSGMLISFSESSSIPKQNELNDVKVSMNEILRVVLMSSMAGILVGFLPAVGISEAAVLMQNIGGVGSERGFLMMTSGINVANDVFSLISVYLVGNPRSGASVAIQGIMGEPTFFETLFLVGTMVLVSGISAYITLFLGKKIPPILEKINYKRLTLVVISFIIFLVYVITGIYGILVLFTSTSIGVLCVNLGVRRSNCMGILLIPTICFFLELNPIIISILNI